MNYRFISTSLLALSLCLSACDRGAPKKVDPTNTTELTDTGAPMPEVEQANYKSREGRVFYYEGESGQLTGVADLGEADQIVDAYQLIRSGDHVIEMDGGRFAATKPGSAVVRLLRKEGMGNVLVNEATLPLDGDSIAAVAMRDALAGRLQPPTTSTPKQVATASTVSEPPSFDCRKATTDVEKMICESPKLSERDAEMTRLYSDWIDKIRSGTMIDSLKETQADQRAWVIERNKCADPDCLLAVYNARIEQLPGSGLSFEN